MGGRALVIAGDNCRRRPIGGELRSREPISAYGHGSPVLRCIYRPHERLSADCLQARALEGLSRMCAVYTVACVNNCATAIAAVIAAL